MGVVVLDRFGGWRKIRVDSLFSLRWNLGTGVIRVSARLTRGELGVMLLLTVEVELIVWLNISLLMLCRGLLYRFLATDCWGFGRYTYGRASLLLGFTSDSTAIIRDPGITFQSMTFAEFFSFRPLNVKLNSP